MLPARPRVTARTLVAAALLAVVALAGTPPATAAERPPHDKRVDLTFPVAGPVSYSDTYDADRDGGARKHQATDLMADKLQRVHAARGGVVCLITGVSEAVPSWGYAVKVCGDDGREYWYLHLNNDRPRSDDGKGGVRWAYAPGVRSGVRVARGQWLGYVGDSGAAESTAPHLHLEIHEPGLDDPTIAEPPYLDADRLDPYFSLRAAEADEDLPNRTYPRPEPVARLGSGTTGTAVALSKASPSRASTVIVVPQRSPYEALVAAPLAGLSNGVVLPIPASGVNRAVRREIERLAASNAYILGRRSQLSTSVEGQLRELGIANPARIAARSPTVLSVKVAREMESYPRYAVTRAYLTPAGGWTKALAVSALAAKQRAPVLLTLADRLPPPVATVLGELAPAHVTVVGSRISDATVVEAGKAAGVTARRLGAGGTYRSSLRIAQASRRAGLRARRIFVASGRSWQQGMAAGPVAARARAVLLLVDGSDAEPTAVVERWLARNSAFWDRGAVLGGTGAVSEAVRLRLGKRLAGR